MPATVPIVFGSKDRPEEPHRGTKKHPGGQVSWLAAMLTHRVCVVTPGRRAGKTSTLDFLDWEEGGRCADLYRSAYVAQSHKQAEQRYEERLRQFDGAGMLVRAKNKGQDRWIEVRRWAVEGFPGNKGAIFDFWSGEEDAIDNTRGGGLHRLKIDEATFIPEASMAALKPMVVDRDGKTVIVGTPKPEGVGFAWFRRVFYMGQPGPKKNPDYISFNAPTECNPFIDPARVAKERLECLTKAEEQNEYDGLFVEDDAAVFGNLDAVFSIKQWREERWPNGKLLVAEDFDPSLHYVVGCDWGKFDDATVISVFCLETKRQVAVGWMNRVDYHEQFPNVHLLCERYGKPLVVADERGEGALCVERLHMLYGDRVLGIKWSGGSSDDNMNNKAVAVTRGRHLCQQGGWALMDAEIQREEFRLFARTKRPRDNGYFYEAPDGYHDDFVAAGLLAGMRLQLPVPAASRKIIEPSYWTLDETDKRQKRRDWGSALARGGMY